jgi:CheY-like chemotaxis protein
VEIDSVIDLLVIDDDLFYRDCIAAILDGVCETCLVETGSRGIGIFRDKLFSDTPFKGVIVDNHMPYLKGVEVVRQIREVESIHNKGRTPIIVASSEPLEENDSEVLLFEKVVFLKKPFTEHELTKQLVRLGIINDLANDVVSESGMDWKHSSNE